MSTDKCEMTECGFSPDGLRVRAITDMMGSQVVVTDDNKPKQDSLLSEPLSSHEEAICFGKNVSQHGINIYDTWRGPISSLVEFAYMLISCA